MERIRKYLSLRVRVFAIAFFMVTFHFFQNQYAFPQNESFEEEEPIRAFTLRELSGALEFRFEYEEDQEKGIGRTFELRRDRFEERLNLRSRGSIYHPNLLEFRLGASLGLRQEQFWGDFEDKEKAILHEYDLNLNFLRQKPYNFNLFANRSSTTISRLFFETIKVDTDFYGGIFHYQNELFPATLLLQSQNTKEDSRDFRRDRTEKTAELRISNKLEDILRSEFRYVYKDLIEKIPSTQETPIHNISLSNALDYMNVHGASNISFLKTYGAFPTDTLQVIENFYIEHSKTFRTLYNYNFNYFASDYFHSIANKGDIGFQHKLYKSLETEVRGEVSLTESTDFRELYYGPRFSLHYRKIVPGGFFSAGYNFIYRRGDRKAEAGIIKVFGERIVLTDAQRTFLANPNLILSSVVVRDAFGVILTLNVDYRLIQVGNLTEIQRVGLPDGTLVIVDYDYLFPRSLEYYTLSNGVSLRYDYRQLLSFSYNYINTRQKEISDLNIQRTISPLTDTEKSLYGVELRWRWFNIVIEYEDDNSDLIPFEAWRLRGSFIISPTDFSIFTLTGNHTQTKYEKDRRMVTINSADTLLNLRLNSFLEATLGVGYLKEKGRDIDTRALKFKGDLRSRFRSIELKLQSEYLRRQEIGRERNEFLIKFKFIRYFNIL